MLQYMKRSEETEQITLIHWCNVNICKYPELELIYHVPEIALRQYTKKCLIDEIRMTNQIEGVNSTKKEINDILKG